jgi:hypothetical protein
VQLNKGKNTASIVAPLPVDDKSDEVAITEKGQSAVDLTEQSQTKTALPILASHEYYFAPKELSEKPHLLQDIPPDLALSVPDISPRSVILQLLINEEGSIDRVVMSDFALPEQAKQLLTDTFSKIKFQPGKIDGVAVKSQFKIEVMLQDQELAAEVGK